MQEFLASTNEHEHWDYACRICRADGEVRWIETQATTVVDESGTAIRMYGTIADITERKDDEAKMASLAQQAMDASAKVRVFFDQSRYYAGILTLDGVLADANRTRRRIAVMTACKKSASRLTKQSWWRDLPEMQARVRQGIKIAAEGKEFSENLNFRIATGAYGSLSLPCRPSKTMTDNVIYLLASGQDITDKVAFEDELIHTRRLADAANRG